MQPFCVSVVQQAAATRPGRASRTEQTQSDPAGTRFADYSYAHGGKDGHPFPVDRQTYDRSIAVLTEAVRKARIGQTDKADALRRLAAAGQC